MATRMKKEEKMDVKEADAGNDDIEIVEVEVEVRILDPQV